MVNSSPEKARFIDGAFDLYSKDGKIYGIASFMYSTGLLYNKKMFKIAGINNIPTTWDEFAATAQKVQEKNPQSNGFSILGMDWADCILNIMSGKQAVILQSFNLTGQSSCWNKPVE